MQSAEGSRGQSGRVLRAFRHHPSCLSVAVASTAGILEIKSTEGFTDVQNVGRECIGIVESQLLVLQGVQSLYSAFPAGRCRMVSSCLL